MYSGHVQLYFYAVQYFRNNIVSILFLAVYSTIAKFHSQYQLTERHTFPKMSTSIDYVAIGGSFLIHQTRPQGLRVHQFSKASCGIKIADCK